MSSLCPVCHTKHMTLINSSGIIPQTYAEASLTLYTDFVYESGQGRFVPETIIHFLRDDVQKKRMTLIKTRNSKLKIYSNYVFVWIPPRTIYYNYTMPKHIQTDHRIVVGWHAATEFISQLFVWQTHLL